MILRSGSPVRAAIASLILALVLSTACDDDTPFEGFEPGWAFLGLDGLKDGSTKVLELDRPSIYVCAGTDGLYRGRIVRANPRWQCLGFADSTVCGVLREGELSENAPVARIGGTGVRDAAVLEDGDILVAMDYRKIWDSQITWLPGLYRSEDMGVSWQRSDSGMAAPDGGGVGITYLEVDPCGDGIVFAGNTEWLYRSLDGGVSWARVMSAPYLNDVRIHPNDCSIWAGGESLRDWGYLIKSVDGGQSWEFIHPVLDIDGEWPFGMGVLRIALVPGDPDIVYVVTAWSGINKTEDGGSVWITPFFHSNLRTGAIVVDPRNPLHLFIGYGPVVYESVDGGETYEALEVPDGSAVVDLEYETYGAVLCVATDTGIYRYRSP